MGFATHLGPWLLGTVKNTTGTTAGTVQNTGCTIVAQSFNLTAAQVATGSIAAGFIPAGSLITSVQILTTTLFASATTLQVSIGGTATASATTITSAGTYPVTIAATFTPTQANVGSTDAALTFTTTGSSSTGAVTVLVAYMVRNSDGAMQPSASQN
jgi:flagellar basal body-associated protein FliL